MARYLGQSFGVGVESARQWLGANREHLRVLRQDRLLVGGLLLIPMGHFFGGRRVNTTGIAGLCIAPHERGTGMATRLMQATLDELHQSGIALSTLYPATYPLYRRVGYDLAGGYYRTKVPARAIAIADRELPMRPVGDDDLPVLRRLYRHMAHHRHGWLDRGTYIWGRVHRPHGESRLHAYAVEGPSGIEGYVFYRIERIEPMGFDISVTDMVATTTAAARRLLGFFSDQAAQVRDVIWHAGLDDPLLYLMPERGYRVNLEEPWMLRLVDVPAALSERGYAVGVSARLDLAVIDDRIGKNHGRFILEVADGRAQVRGGGRGSLEIDVRALASLYAGQAMPQQLAMIGQLAGSEATLSRAAAIFAAPCPSLADFF